MANEQKLLLVEGNNDRMFVEKIVPDRKFTVRQTSGIHKLFEQVRVEVKRESLITLGIIIDSDYDARVRWRQLRNCLKDIGLPAVPAEAGTIIPEDIRHPRVGIWLMPNNKTQGALEEFAVKMIPSNDSVWPLAKKYIDSISLENRMFVPEKRQRAEFYAWLATTRSSKYIDEAIESGALRTDGPLMAAFTDWLRCLFD